MKTVLNIVLAACAAALVYVCYGSIMGPINFDNTKKARETEVIARLIDIRKAQVEYRNTHEGIADFSSGWKGFKLSKGQETNRQQTRFPVCDKETPVNNQ